MVALLQQSWWHDIRKTTLNYHSVFLHTNTNIKFASLNFQSETSQTQGDSYATAPGTTCLPSTPPTSRSEAPPKVSPSSHPGPPSTITNNTTSTTPRNPGRPSLKTPKRPRSEAPYKRTSLTVKRRWPNVRKAVDWPVLALLCTKDQRKGKNLNTARCLGKPQTTVLSRGRQLGTARRVNPMRFWTEIVIEKGYLGLSPCPKTITRRQDGSNYLTKIRNKKLIRECVKFSK